MTVPDPVQLRSAMSPLLARAELARGNWNYNGQTFYGKRDFNRALGYRHVLTPDDYWYRYKRGGIAKRIVEAFPKSTWRAGGEVIEDEDPDVNTAFEKAWVDLDKRLNIWSTFSKLDILAGLGHYAVLFYGAPGNVYDPLESCKPQDLKYLTPFAQRNLRIESFIEDEQDERFGQPEFYTLIFRRIVAGVQRDKLISRVHYSRVLHVAEGALEDPIFGQPRLEAVWDYLDDLIKCVGGGSEAFWKRIDGGKQIKLDPTMPLPTPEQSQALHDMIEEYTHELRRVLTTRGVEIQDLGSNIGNFQSQVSSILDLISATTGIPQRILMGSERGELSSTQDQSNYDDRIEDRRHDFAEPMVVRPFVDRMIELGVLPEADYDVRWPEIKNLNDAQRMAMAQVAATVNQTQGEVVVTTNEIRDRILGFPALTDEQIAEEQQKKQDAIKQQQDMFAAKANVVKAVKDKAAADSADNTDKTDNTDSPTAALTAAEESMVAALEAVLIEDDYEAAEAIVATALKAGR